MTCEARNEKSEFSFPSQATNLAPPLDDSIAAGDPESTIESGLSGDARLGTGSLSGDTGAEQDFAEISGDINEYVTRDLSGDPGVEGDLVNRAGGVTGDPGVDCILIEVTGDVTGDPGVARGFVRKPGDWTTGDPGVDRDLIEKTGDFTGDPGTDCDFVDKSGGDPEVARAGSWTVTSLAADCGGQWI